MMPIKSTSRHASRKPRSAGNSLDARRLCIEKLDVRVVLSANGLVGAMYAGPAIAGDHAIASLVTSSMPATGGGDPRDFTSFRQGIVSPSRVDGHGSPARTDNQPVFGMPTSPERFDNSKPNSPGVLDQNFANPRNSYDTYHGFGNAGIGSAALLKFDHATQSGLFDLHAFRPQLMAVVLVSSQWPVPDRSSSRFLFDQIAASLGRSNDLAVGSQTPSEMANSSSIAGSGGKSNSLTSVSGSIAIPGRSTGGQAPNSPLIVDSTMFGPLGLTVAFANPTSAVTNPSGRSNDSLSTVLSTPAMGRPLATTAEGGLVDISANMQSGTLAIPRLPLDTDLGTAAATEEPEDEAKGDSKDIEKFWADLGEELESLEPTELALDIPRADGDDVDSASDSVSLVDQAVAIYDGEGGMVELSVNQSPAAARMASGADARSTAQVPRQATPKSVEIEMDAAVAMFQAFELETAPTNTRPVKGDAAEASDVEAIDDSSEKPQPVDRASVGPLSILFAIASTAMSERDRKVQQPQGLGKKRMDR